MREGLMLSSRLMPVGESVLIRSDVRGAGLAMEAGLLSGVRLQAPRERRFREVRPGAAAPGTALSRAELWGGGAETVIKRQSNLGS
ncbi:protein of unknown function [Cyanobium sp. NIES-981]|nr:protein of unknown function [Cyanobium sp. NIES-981]